MSKRALRNVPVVARVSGRSRPMKVIEVFRGQILLMKNVEGTDARSTVETGGPQLAYFGSYLPRELNIFDFGPIRGGRVFPMFNLEQWTIVLEQ